MAIGTRLTIGVVLAAAAGAALALPGWAAEEGVSLTWKFAKGSTRAYAVDSTAEQTAVGMPMKMGTTIVQEMSEAVTASAGTGGTVEWTLTRVQFKADLGPAGKLNYDSDNAADKAKENHQLLKQLVPLIKNPVTYASEATGKITKVGMAPGKAGAGMDETNLRQLIEDNHLAFPAKPLKKGDSWSVDTDVPMPQMAGTAVRTRTYTMEGVETKDGKKVARLSVKEVYKAKGEGGGGEDLVDPDEKEGKDGKAGDEDGDEEAASAKMSPLEGEGKGEVLFLVDEGYILENTIETKLSTKISMGQATIVMEVVQKSSAKLKK